MKSLVEKSEPVEVDVTGECEEVEDVSLWASSEAEAVVVDGQVAQLGQLP